MLDGSPITEHLRKRAMEASQAAFSKEEESLVSWRFHQLISAGSDEHYAQVIAERLDVSLHAAIELLERGCAPGTAAAILL